MEEKNEVQAVPCELNDADLEAVSGGKYAYPAVRVVALGRRHY